MKLRLSPSLLASFASLIVAGSIAQAAQTVFVEAESFENHGGWSLDTSFTHVVGSPYLLAHGLGKAVKDATGNLQLTEAGEYRVWVRTKDWVGPWKVSGTPGRFQLVVNGKPLAAQFGTEGAEWHWQNGGTVKLKAGVQKLALHDLTGFDGRCDAILFTSDPSYSPPEGQALVEARNKWLNPGGVPEDMGEFDLVVCGGGYAGVAAAVSAARQSLKVALIQDRFVLGGNGSSEIGVWAQGGTMRGKYPHIGEIVEEFADRAPDSPGRPEDFVDDKKEKVCRSEKTLSLYLGHFVHSAKMDASGKIASVRALDVKSGREREFRGKLFVDCTGHGTVGAAAGAQFTMEETGHMGMSNMWYYQLDEQPSAWPETPWALPLTMEDFPKVKESKSKINEKPFLKAEWFWESGFNKHPINDLELIRDWNLRAAFGAFSAIKRGASDDEKAKAALKWVSHVGGPRESRLLQGDVVLTQDDIVAQKDFPDGMVATTWDIDLHYPREQYAAKFPDNPFISRAEFGKHVDRKNGYPVPYRCFYSKNVANLFMAGRNISVTHQALGTIRVMRTCGMMGEVVGKAAYIAVLHKSDPRGVYERHLKELIQLVSQPGAMRRDGLNGELRRDPSIPDPSTLAGGWMNRDLPQFATHLHKAIGEAPQPLTGIVIDDSKAKLVGKWASSHGLLPNVGGAYQYASAGTDAEARFEFKVPNAGKYEIRVYWAGHENRASKAPCSIERPGQSPVTLRLNQKENSPDGAHSLGTFDFAAEVTNSVVLRAAGSDGTIHADAVQIIPAK